MGREVVIAVMTPACVSGGPGRIGPTNDSAPSSIPPKEGGARHASYLSWRMCPLVAVPAGNCVCPGVSSPPSSGTFPRGRGRLTPVGTGIPSPNAQNVPVGRRMHPAARNVPVSVGGGPEYGGEAVVGSDSVCTDIDAASATAADNSSGISGRYRSGGRVGHRRRRNALLRPPERTVVARKEAPQRVVHSAWRPLSPGFARYHSGNCSQSAQDAADTSQRSLDFNHDCAFRDLGDDRPS